LLLGKPIYQVARSLVAIFLRELEDEGLGRPVVFLGGLFEVEGGTSPSFRLKKQT